ncbi:hypothetical protein Cgig2_030768 [Carnegiea gigantea]|uniref:Uncharacterized protein n=1 Tax=Carnegiea gigantea TaxID=171969 RepID=A0A9Q1KT25_9CARY|nr:hypothetical protein Cgig2_030768 [Carnegiea gigantea]
MAVMNPNLLLKQYHPKSSVSLGALWTVCIRLTARAEQVKKKSETVVESRAINSYTFRGRLIYSGIRLRDHEGIPDRQEGRPLGWGSDCPNHPAGPSGLGPLGTPELVDAPSDDELLDELLEEELEEASPEEELVLVEATSTPGFDEVGAKQGLPCIPSASSSLGDLMRGVDLVFAILRTWKSGYVTSTSELRILGVEEYSRFKKRHRMGNLFRFPILILSGDARHHPTINKGRKARELQMVALHLGTGQPLRNVLT